MQFPRQFIQDVAFSEAKLLSTLLIFHLVVVASTIPEDIVPLNTYEAQETSSYPSFRGSMAEGSTSKHSPMLQDFQGMKKIGRKCYIYARHKLFVIDMTTPESKFNEIPYKQALQWNSTDKDMSLCKKKGQTEKSCKSYIKIFEKDPAEDNRVVLCSTNSFNPSCRFYELSDDGTLSNSWQDFPGLPWRCPYDPAKRVASLISDGSLYSGTETGFSGQDAVIHRSSLVSRRTPNLRTSRGVATFLNDPTFVRFIDGGRSLNKVYAFFTETAMEDKSYQTYSRVSQVCKNDIGGVNMLKHQFSSFFKARLNCSLPGQPPFYFNEIQSVSDLLTLNRFYDVGNTRMVFAIMTTPRNSVPASAVCAFTLEDIETSLNGPFKEQFTRESTRKTYWDVQTSYPEPHLASCRGEDRTLSDAELNFARKHPFMHSSVPSWNLADNLVPGHHAQPIYSKTRSRAFLTTIAVDTTAGLSSKHTVLIVGSQDGKITKILLLKEGSSVVIEERYIFNEENCNQTNKSVQKIVLDKESGTMIVAFQDCIIKAPLCPMASTCGRKCVESRDPYCGWDGNNCVMVDRLYVNKSKASRSSQIRQDVVNGNVDGMPDCAEVVVKGRAPLAGATAPTSLNSSGQFDGTVPLNDAVAQGTVPLATATADPIVMYILIGVVCLTLGCIVGIMICHLLHKSRKKYGNMKKKDLANTYSNETPQNTYVSVRHGSTNSNKKSRPPSNSSHQNQRHSNPRPSSHEENKRNRTITETSTGNRSDEVMVMGQHGEGHSPESPTGREIPDTKQLQLTGTNVGGRRKARNSKPSTSSSPENNEEMIGSHQGRDYHTEGRMPEPGHDAIGDLSKPRSNDSGNASEGLVPSPESDVFTVMPPSHSKGTRSAPSRSMSFQDHHPPLMERTYTIATNGANTVGAHRPHGRGINRQLSLQPTDLLPRQQVYQQTPSRGYPAQPPPITPGRMPQPLASVNATPNKNFDNRRVSDMTHSLDRRRKKGQNFQQVFSEAVDQDYPMGASASLQPPRKRFVSESEKAARMPRQNLYQAINEEQEPLMHHPHPTERLQDPKAMRNNLSLKLKPTYPGTSNGPASHSAPVVEPGTMMSNPRRHPNKMVTYSNPGTPMGDHPPSLMEQGYPMGTPKGHTTLPSQKNHYVPHQMSLPEEMHQRMAFPAESPTKHTASSPMQDGRPPSFPGSERVRHGSGPGYLMQGNRSPVKPNGPMPMGSPNFNPQLMNGMRTRYPSGGTGRNQNGKVMHEIQPENQHQATSPQMPSILQSSTIP